MKKIYNKLVRDKIPEIIERNGDECYTRILNAVEYKNELLNKIVEEAEEVKETKGNKKEIENIRKERKQSRGGFDKKIFLEYTK